MWGRGRPDSYVKGKILEKIFIFFKKIVLEVCYYGWNLTFLWHANSFSYFPSTDYQFSLLQREFEGIADHFKNHDHIRLILKYDESLSHAIYAASDMFIIPSIFEPCGLTQVRSKWLFVNFKEQRNVENYCIVEYIWLKQIYAPFFLWYMYLHGKNCFNIS